MNGVVSQFHKAYPAYAKTKVKVVYVPWTNATTEFTNALSSGKNAPDVTEIGNTETPTNASLGMLANITSNVNAWSNKSTSFPACWPTTPERQHLRRAVVRRRPGHLLPHRPVQGGRHHVHPDHVVRAGQRRAEAAAEVPRHVRPGRAQRLHQRHRQLHLGRRGPGSGAEERQVGRRAELAAVRGWAQVYADLLTNWSTADQTDQIIPTMMKSLMQGADFTATVDKANTQLQNVLNTGSSS